jgi:hypothetical protein
MKILHQAIPIFIITLCLSCSKSDSNDYKFTYPSTYIYKSHVLGTTEFYLRTSNSEYTKINAPDREHSFDQDILKAIEDDIHYPYKEITLTSATRLNVITKNGTVYSDNKYNILNGNELNADRVGFIGTFSTDQSRIIACYSFFAVSDSSFPIPINPFRGGQCIANKEFTIGFVKFGLYVGDTLAVNFPEVIYEKK